MFLATSLPVTLLTWGAAMLPIALLIILMVGFQWSANKAAPISLAVAVFNSFFLYKASAHLVLLESLKGTWSALSVFLVILPAILIYEVTDEANAFNVFRRGMRQFTPNELLQVIAVGWVFVSFLQGITGFGVPVAVGAPLLVGIGVKPFYAVIIPLVGHAWANTFGTLGVAWDSLVETTEMVPYTQQWLMTALWASLFVWIFNAVTGVLVCWLYGGFKALKKGLPAILVISLVHGGGQMLLSRINPIIAAFIPATLAILAVALLGRLPFYQKSWKIEDSACMDRTKIHDDEDSSVSGGMTLVEAFSPYAVLVVITFIALAIPQVNRVLATVKLGFSFPETMTGYGVVNKASSLYAPIGPFVHAGLFLSLSALYGFLFFKKKGYISQGRGTTIIMRSLKKAIPSILSVVFLLIMSKVMSGTGQTDVLAEGTAKVLGRYYAALAPFIGVLGSFMTSSNLASNILFGSFQQTNAMLLNLDPSAILGAQTAGGAIGNTICPGNVVLATTTAGILGEEGAVLRKTLPIAVGVAIFIGLILLVLVL